MKDNVGKRPHAVPSLHAGWVVSERDGIRPGKAHSDMPTQEMAFAQRWVAGAEAVELLFWPSTTVRS